MSPLRQATARFFAITGLLIAHSALAQTGETTRYLQPDAGKVSIVGARKRRAEVRIRTVNDSGILWTDDRVPKLTRRVWVEPGRHRLTVMCHMQHGSGEKILTGTVELEARGDRSRYVLEADPDSSDNRVCVIRIN